ncbi:hypothetical protein COB57_01380 [Candidatus Peregrinibacteria bacterium]|nr:MAG: hypothetical protein COB57_01380 [Candidatus Peregrinibacteria bacterium]
MKKLACITGTASGMGKAILKNFLKNDFLVIVINRTEKESFSAEFTEEINKTLFPVYGDVSRAETQDTAFLIAKKIGIPITVLVNNAGTLNRTSFLDEDPEHAKEVFDVHVMAPFSLSQKMKKHLPDDQTGVIINIGSLRGIIPTGILYSASKTALHGMTRGLAQELAPQIRVVCVAPGLTKTEMHAHKTEEELHAMAAGSMMNTLVEPEDIADMVEFLVSDKAKAITGETFSVDNGGTLVRPDIWKKHKT